MLPDMDLDPLRRQAPLDGDRRRWLRASVGAGMAAAIPALLPARAQASADPLVVGGLAVTCNLTLPVACVSKAASNATAAATATQYAFEYNKYNGWPEIKESLMTGRIQAAYMLAPLVMDLADKGIPRHDAELSGQRHLR